MYQKQLLVVQLVNCPTLNSKGSSISSPAEELFYGKRTQMVMWDFGFMFGICMCFVLGFFRLFLCGLFLVLPHLLPAPDAQFQILHRN